jgi:hypothetical protein
MGEVWPVQPRCPALPPNLCSLHSLGMGDDADGPTGTALLDVDPGVRVGLDDRVGGVSGTGEDEDRTGLAAGRRRFTWAAVIGTGVVAIPYVWILWGLWGNFNPLRQTIYEDNFYDLQARAMFHGHLYVPNGNIGIEAFIHDGRTYTYFGIFPSLIRMPILLVTSSLDGKLTAPFMLLAWLATALFASLLLWRVRILVRGAVVMSRAEAASFGVMMAAIMGGSVLMYLAASPYVFSEDLAWSVCLTVGSLFALLGVLERPSWSRVVASGVLILLANLDRPTTGWACVVAAVLIAVWFGLGRGGREHRRWWLPMLLVGLIPLVVSIAINMAKFDIPFGVPITEQLWTKVNAYRRQFLAANHNSEVGAEFIPSNVLAYLQPFGLRITSAFPFITLPATPAHALSGVLFDKRYRTDSLPPSTPLLFLLSCWGLVTAFRPRPVGQVALTRILLLAAGSAGAALFLWGYIAPRYLADFVPLLVLAGAVGLADIWRRLDGRSHRIRVGVFAVVALVGAFSIAANVGLSITPSEEWNSTQALHFVEAQKSIGDLTGQSLRDNVVRGSTLPAYGPGDQLFIVGDCDGLYISNGENYATVPSQLFQRYNWMVVERGHAYQHTFRVTVRAPSPGSTKSVALVRAGARTVAVSAQSTAKPGQVRVTLGLYGPGRPVYGVPALVDSGSTHQVVVVTDPAKRVVQASLDGTIYMTANVANDLPISVVTQRGDSGGSPPSVGVTNVTSSTPEPTLCKSLEH